MARPVFFSVLYGFQLRVAVEACYMSREVADCTALLAFFT